MSGRRAYISVRHSGPPFVTCVVRAHLVATPGGLPSRSTPRVETGRPSTDLLGIRIIITPPPRSGRPGPASPRSRPWPPWRPASRGEGERRPRERRLTPRHPAPARGARSRSRRRGRGRAPASGTPRGSGQAGGYPIAAGAGPGAAGGRARPAWAGGSEGPHDGRVLHDGDDPQPAPTAGTGEDIEGDTRCISAAQVHAPRGAAGAGPASTGGGRRQVPRPLNALQAKESRKLPSWLHLSAIDMSAPYA